MKVMCRGWEKGLIIKGIYKLVNEVSKYGVKKTKAEKEMHWEKLQEINKTFFQSVKI